VNVFLWLDQVFVGGVGVRILRGMLGSGFGVLGGGNAGGLEVFGVILRERLLRRGGASLAARFTGSGFCGSSGSGVKVGVLSLSRNGLPPS
jgi:hypothetical protein